MKEVNQSEVHTIALIQINSETGDLLVSMVNEEHRVIATSVTSGLIDSPTIKTDAKGTISIRKIVELLNTIQD